MVVSCIVIVELVHGKKKRVKNSMFITFHPVDRKLLFHYVPSLSNLSHHILIYSLDAMYLDKLESYVLLLHIYPHVRVSRKTPHTFMVVLRHENEDLLIFLVVQVSSDIYSFEEMQDRM